MIMAMSSSKMTTKSSSRKLATSVEAVTAENKRSSLIIDEA